MMSVPPYGFNANPGEYSTIDNPGIRWWLAAPKEMRKAYIAEAENTLNSK